MEIKYFISYSGADGLDDAKTIYDTITTEKPNIKLWWDKLENRLQHANNWSRELKRGINDSEGLIYLMTSDSLQEKSICLNEVMHARNCKKPIILLKLDYDIEKDMDILDNLQQIIDFSNDYDSGLNKLIERLVWLNSPEGKLRQLEDRMAYLEKDLLRANEGSIMQRRINEKIAILEEQIKEQKRIVADPEGAEKHVKDNIMMEVRAQLDNKLKETTLNKNEFSKHINQPPLIAPKYFQNRTDEISQMAEFINNDAQRILMISGESGMGKTALSCYVLKALENDKIPESNETVSNDGIIYLSEASSSKITFNNTFNGLCKLLPNDEAQELIELNKTAGVSIGSKTAKLVSKFTNKKVIILLDHFDNLLTDDASDINDKEIKDMLHAFLESQHHTVKIIITTPKIPFNIISLQSGRQRFINLKGLQPEFSKNLLQGMDENDRLGLSMESDDMLNKVHIQTNGNPRALETVFTILSADTNATLESIISSTAKSETSNLNNDQNNETTTEFLVDEAFNRLDKNSEMIIQALAIYNDPVPSSAIDFLLFPYTTGIKSSKYLAHLKNAQFVFEDNGKYTINSEYTAYALSRIQEGSTNDYQQSDNKLFTKFSLYHLGAEYWKITQIPEENWTNLTHVYAHIKEIEMLTKAGDYSLAILVVDDISRYLFDTGDHKQVIDLVEPLIPHLTHDEYILYYYELLAFAFKQNTQYHDAITYLKQGVELAKKEKNIQNEARYYGHLGDCYRSLGNTKLALEIYQKALVLDHEIIKEVDLEDFFQMSEHLCRIGECYLMENDLERAYHYLTEARNTSTKSNYLEGNLIADKGIAGISLLKGEFQDAVYKFEAVLNGAVTITDSSIQNMFRYDLGLAYLFNNELKNAMRNFDEASNYKNHDNIDNLFSIIGITALLMDDKMRAKNAFNETISIVEDQLKYAAENFDGLYSMAKSYVGLALIEEESNHYLEKALTCFTKTLNINSDYGTFKNEILMLNTLFTADKNNVLEDFTNQLYTVYENISKTN